VNTDIAIIGFAGRFPGARSAGEFWNNVRSGVDSLTRFTSEELAAAGVAPAQSEDPDFVAAGMVLQDIDLFDAGFFGFNPQEAALLDPQHRHFLECCWEALEHAGHVPERFDGSIGVFAGSGMNAYLMYNLLTNPRLIDSLGLFFVRHTGNDKDFLATRVSYCLNLTGPSINVQTACSTSLVAVHSAAQSLLNRESDMCLAGGVTIELPHGRGYVYKDGEILSPDGHCRPFDAEARGTVFGSGVGVVALRRLDDALASGDMVHAVIRGSAVNNDGATKVGYFAPSVTGQAHAIAEALMVADVPADTISYVEAHGTGTPVGDPIEVTALTQAFRAGTAAQGYCALGSVKSNIGHLDTAAGVAGLIKVVQALSHRELPPTLNFTRPNPALDIERTPFYVNNSLREWSVPPGVPRRAGINSLGVGGTNAFMVLEEAPPAAPTTTSTRPQLLLLSARSAAALDAATARLADHLIAEDTSLEDTAYTLALGRRAWPHRRSVVCSNLAEAVAALDGREPRCVHTGTASAEPHQVAFMFAGGGAQYPGMAAELYGTEPVFREELDRCLALLGPALGPQVFTALFPAEPGNPTAGARLSCPSVALPALFAVQYAQARLWQACDIEPAALIGHSMGEYTAACIAGVFSLEDALGVVALRGRLLESLTPGSMLSVQLPAEELEAFLDERTAVAAVNAPALSVAAGPAASIDALERELGRRGIEARRVHIAVAAHSPLVEPVLGEFGDYIASLTLRPPRIPIASNLSGDWLSAEEATDPGYWVRHLRETVRFADGIATVLHTPDLALLEVGPGRTLSTLAKQHAAAEGRIILTSLRHPEEAGSDAAFMLGTLGRLWTAGVQWDPAALHRNEHRRRVPLPTYPFEHKRYWIEPGAQPGGGARADEPPQRAPFEDWFWQPAWTPAPPSPHADGETGAVIVFADDEGLGVELATTLEQRGRSVTLVRPAAEFGPDQRGGYGIAPGNVDDYDRLLEAVCSGAGLPHDIVHLWSTGADAGAAEEMERGFLAIAALVQAIGRREESTPVRILCVTSGAQQVSGEPVPSPVRALVSGLVATVPREYPHLTCRWVDVPDQGNGERAFIVDLLAAETGSDCGDEVVTFRGRNRFVRSFTRVRLGGAGVSVKLREHGVYIITGGLGGMGLTLAAELAASGPCTLVLTARHPLPPQATWDDYLLHAASGDRAARRIRRIREIEARGAVVIPAAVDVTDCAGMRSLLTQVRQRFGAIHGVVHAAGVLNDGLLQLRSRDEMLAVLAPKVRGALLLAEILRDEPLDFFVLCSSMSAFAGLPGQSDYGASNAFLDAFAAGHALERPGRTVAIGWGPWRDVGMLADLAEAAEDVADMPTGRPTGQPLASRCTADAAAGATYVAVLSTTDDWVLGEHRLSGGDALMPGSGFLQLARDALADRYGDGPLELRDVLFVNPAFVPDGSRRRFTTRIEQAASGVVEWVITSSAATGGTGDMEHARGEYAPVEQPCPTRESLAAVLDRCGTRRSRADALSRALQFGPRWQALQQVHLGENEAVIELRLPEHLAAEPAAFALHPALLDLATAGAQALIPGYDAQRDLFVPVAYGSLRQWQPFTPAMYSHVRWIEESGADDGYAMFDVTMMDVSGQVLGEVAGFTMKRVGAAALQGERAVPPRESSLASTLRGAIRPEDGAAALRRILAVPSASHVVVSPFAVDEWLAHSRPVAMPSAPAAPQQVQPAPELEITATVLRSHEAVRDAAVLSRRDASGEMRIVAYIVSDQTHTATGSELRRFVRGQVPPEFVPHLLLDVGSLSRGPDGTLDARELPNPYATDDDLAAPETATERLLATIWQEALGVDRVGVHDNFLDLGGHSLLAIRVLTRLHRETGVRLAPNTMVLQTLGQMARICDTQLEKAINAPDA
jgi:acyl transferase domain-containing protein